MTLQIAPGSLPLVVGTLSSARWELLRSVSEVPCDIVEVRLDEIGCGGDWLERCRAVEASGLPVVLTIRLGAEGGKWVGPEEERLALYYRALEHVSAVDVELRSGIVKAVVERAKRMGRFCLVSYHDFERTPPLSGLQAVLNESLEFAAIAKVATMIHGEADLETLRGLLAANRKAPVCVMGMGPLGGQTRVGLAANGSCLAYGYLDKPAAPGQLSAAELVRGIRAVLPAYDQRRAALERTSS